jgi:hypothetical protein
MAARRENKSYNLSDLIKVSNLSDLIEVSNLIDYAMEWGEFYETARIWLVLDEEGHVLGEVQARLGVLAALYAYRQWPTQRGGRRTVLLKEAYEAQRN